MRVLQKEAADGSVDVVEMASRLSAMGYRVTVGARPPSSCNAVTAPHTSAMMQLMLVTVSDAC